MFDLRTNITKYQAALAFYMPTDITAGCLFVSEYTTLQTFLPTFHLVQQKLPCSCFANLLRTKRQNIIVLSV
jgi:hypothetical protein